MYATLDYSPECMRAIAIVGGPVEGFYTVNDIHDVYPVIFSLLLLKSPSLFTPKVTQNRIAERSLLPKGLIRPHVKYVWVVVAK